MLSKCTLKEVLRNYNYINKQVLTMVKTHFDSNQNVSKKWRIAGSNR